MGRWFLLAEGVLLIALGIAGFASDAMHPDATPVGSALVSVLAMTHWHSAILLSFGVLAMLSSLRRRAAITITAVGAVVFAGLVIVGAVAAAHHAPGPLGLEPRDIVLHGVLAAANLAVLYWLIPDVLEGPDWIRRPGSQTAHSLDTPLPQLVRMASAGSEMATGAFAEHSRSPKPSANDQTDNKAKSSTGDTGGHFSPQGVLGDQTQHRAPELWFSRHARSASLAAAGVAAVAATVARALRK
ncbi:DUF4383 domain-containing protein [Mycolicibacterium sphagni]|nr:DUF4383 domain-containing protein [Mycolicibacterium sphagni]